MFFICCEFGLKKEEKKMKKQEKNNQHSKQHNARTRPKIQDFNDALRYPSHKQRFVFFDYNKKTPTQAHSLKLTRTPMQFLSNYKKTSLTRLNHTSFLALFYLYRLRKVCNVY